MLGEAPRCRDAEAEENLARDAEKVPEWLERAGEATGRREEGGGQVRR